MPWKRKECWRSHSKVSPLEVSYSSCLQHRDSRNNHRNPTLLSHSLSFLLCVCLQSDQEALLVRAHKKKLRNSFKAAFFLPKDPNPSHLSPSFSTSCCQIPSFSRKNTVSGKIITIRRRSWTRVGIWGAEPRISEGQREGELNIWHVGHWSA